MGELPLSFCSCRLQQTTYMMGLFDSEQYAGVITSSLEVVPESTPGKFRVIVWMIRHTNDPCSLILMHALGSDTQLSKFDIKESYCII